LIEELVSFTLALLFIGFVTTACATAQATRDVLAVVAFASVSTVLWCVATVLA
jgi:hypothetical protein